MEDPKIEVDTYFMTSAAWSDCGTLAMELNYAGIVCWRCGMINYTCKLKQYLIEYLPIRKQLQAPKVYSSSPLLTVVPQLQLAQLYSWLILATQFNLRVYTASCYGHSCYRKTIFSGS